MASHLSHALTRRGLIKHTGAVAAGAALLTAGRLPGGEAAPAPPLARTPRTIDNAGPALPPGQPGQDYTPVIAPDAAVLPWTIVDGVKVYHLIAGEVQHEFAPGLVATCWGYNGRVHGPVLEAVEGDRVRVYVTNRLPEGTTVHWHGVLLPNGMDGVGGLTQQIIAPGETYRYEWTFRQHGTLMYHAHHDEMTQMALGLMGMIVVHPRIAAGPKVDRDFALLLGEWKIAPGTSRPDPNEMTDFNVLTINARCFPGTTPLVARRNERVRLRFGNLSAMDHHPLHLHGHAFVVTGTDGGLTPASAQRPETTVLVPTGSTRDVEFIADNPGDWALHCHMTHHVMNQMGHGLPNLIGIRTNGLDEKMAPLLPDYMTMGTVGMADMGGGMAMPVPRNSLPMVGGKGPFDDITMGGMFTILKVRDELDGAGDPGWYRHPAGSVAALATAAELERDGIRVP